MTTIRKRAKDQLPTVLLTLLSIVQALALELLWTQVTGSTYLFTLDWTALLTWVQTATTFLGIIVIWLVYASTAMRFRWVPSTSDSIYPFVIGLLEFILIETHVPQYFGLWFICMAIIFALMTWVSHTKMRRARQDGENDEFFSQFAPATIRDFYPVFRIVVALLAAGTYVQVSGDRGVIALLAALGTSGMLVWQLITTARFWEMSVAKIESESG